MEHKGKKRNLTLAEQKNIADELKAKKAKYEEDKNTNVSKSMYSEKKKKKVHEPIYTDRLH